MVSVRHKGFATNRTALKLSVATGEDDLDMLLKDLVKTQGPAKTQKISGSISTAKASNDWVGGRGHDDAQAMVRCLRSQGHSEDAIRRELN